MSHYIAVEAEVRGAQFNVGIVMECGWAFLGPLPVPF